MPIDRDLTRLLTQLADIADNELFTGSGFRKVRGRALFNVAHWVAGGVDDLSPDSVADAPVDKLIHVRALTSVDESTMQSLVDAQCRADDVPEQQALHLRAAFDRSLRPADLVIIRYDSETEETMVFGPGLVMTTLLGRESMNAVWRMFFCPADQPELGGALLSAVFAEPDH